MSGTPGPWTVDEMYPHVVRGPDGQQVALCTVHPASPDRETALARARADARLIVAAVNAYRGDA